MAFKGEHTIRAKIGIDNTNIAELVQHFIYLGCEISRGYDINVDKKFLPFRESARLLGELL